MSTADLQLRRYYLIELTLIGLMTPWFLLLAPRDGLLYMAMAVGFGVYIGMEFRLRRRRTRPAVATSSLPLLGHWHGLLILNVISVAVFFGYGLWLAARAPGANHMFGGLALYLPWALLQQFIFLIFLLGRLQVLVPRLRPEALALLNGSLYGVVHWPDSQLMALTALAGSVWAYYYLHSRRLLPVVVSHAVLAVSYYSWVMGRDLFAEFAVRLF
jgi:hypothetical protein